MGDESPRKCKGLPISLKRSTPKEESKRYCDVNNISLEILCIYFLWMIKEKVIIWCNVKVLD